MDLVVEVGKIKKRSARVEVLMTDLEKEELKKLAESSGVTPGRLVYSMIIDRIKSDDSYTVNFKVSKRPSNSIRVRLDDQELELLTKELDDLGMTKSRFFSISC